MNKLGLRLEILVLISKYDALRFVQRQKRKKGKMTYLSHVRLKLK